MAELLFLRMFMSSHNPEHVASTFATYGRDNVRVRSYCGGEMDINSAVYVPEAASVQIK